jgi:hypothetical protein
MSKLGVWVTLWITLILTSVVMVQSKNEYSVEVDRYKTYMWIPNTTSTVIGDGETRLHLISRTGNFTVYDGNDTAVVSGVSPELKPGETAPIFVADFQLESGKKYILENSSVDIYTLSPSKIHFETDRHEFFALLIISIVVLVISLIIAVG